MRHLLYGGSPPPLGLSSCNGPVTLGELLLCQWAHGMGVPDGSPANRHHGIADDGQHLVGGPAHPRDGGSGPGPGWYVAGIRVHGWNPVDVASPPAVGEVRRLIGMAGVHKPVDLRKRLIPVDPNVADRRIVCPRFKLVRNRVRLTRFHRVERLVERGKTFSNQALAEAAGGIAVEHIDTALGQDRAGIDPRLREVARSPRLPVAAGDGPVDGLRPPVPWQQRWMDIQPST